MEVSTYIRSDCWRRENWQTWAL